MLQCTYSRGGQRCYMQGRVHAVFDSAEILRAICQQHFRAPLCLAQRSLLRRAAVILHGSELHLPQADERHQWRAEPSPTGEPLCKTYHTPSRRCQLYSIMFASTTCIHLVRLITRMQSFALLPWRLRAVAQLDMRQEQGQPDVTTEVGCRCVRRCPQAGVVQCQVDASRVRILMCVKLECPYTRRLETRRVCGTRRG